MLNDLYKKKLVRNKTEDLNLIEFNMITGINKSILLTKYISCECKCRFDGPKYSSYRWCNNNRC